jgi:riboflavin kinase/FMN adenylyltransferase
VNRLRVFPDPDSIPPGAFASPTVTLGTFDGVHRGHQAVLRAAVEAAREAGGDAVVLTFPHPPRRVVLGEEESLLLPLARRIELIGEMGTDAVVLLPFTPETASLSAEDFARHVLAGAIGAETVVLGFDARFGRGRRGDAAFLRSLEPGFTVVEVGPVEVDGAPASSSRVRGLIQGGRMPEAARLLGRPVELIGRVEPGRGAGRDLGFPTANLALLHDVRPPEGVYAGAVDVRGALRLAVISIGTAPTLGAQLPLAVEVHIAAFEEDLYGRELRVQVHERLRDQRAFSSKAELASAIRADIERARGLFPA